MKVAIISNIPAPYREPCFVELARKCELHLVYTGGGSDAVNWDQKAMPLGYGHTFVRSLTVERSKKNRASGTSYKVHMDFPIGLLRTLVRLKPDIVVATAFNTSSLLAAAYTRLTGRKLVIWSEGTAHSEFGIEAIRVHIRKALVRLADAFWTNGPLSTEHLRSFGLTSKPVQEGMTGTDTSFFVAQTRHSLAKREALRHSLGVEGTTFLFVGHVAQHKGVTQLATAFQDLHGKGGVRSSLLVAGNGLLSNELASRLGNVSGLNYCALGAVPQSRLPELFAAADVFVLPTLTDNWSLAVLEAACAGLPQIFSCFNGGSSDLLARGIVGRMINPLDRQDFLTALSAYALQSPPRTDANIVMQVAQYYAPDAFACRAMDSFARLRSSQRQVSAT